MNNLIQKIMQKDFMTITPDSGGGVTGSDRCGSRKHW
nr:MAG TPA: hypothetical protein [Caudoviricetes sp.]